MHVMKVGITFSACSKDIQSHPVGPGSHAVLLPLEMEVPPLSFLVADAYTVRHGENQGVGLLSDVQEL
jgi:hypothetical protein